MKAGGKGGANTKTGLHFEARADFLLVLDAVPGYSVTPNGKDDNIVLFDGKPVARHLRKHALYRFLKAECNINSEEILSKKLLPDDAVLVEKTRTLHIVEMKFQGTPGSVDEKLQTCHFKKRQYEKLVKAAGFKIEYVYILNDWFKDPAYYDVLAYIKEVGCDYFFEVLPLSTLDLPSRP